ncbi:hypothetical protein Pflav_059040 [Phytohabitans flavus]|uniref:Gcp-like domain-containing protein n=1 Tax=Phytohabitans flavus TaxID=1076124 RepID=A0A6F8Y070_9ACTN|nr:hypothetical protein Pflav_059040 [Phytohabitans flavus]
MKLTLSIETSSSDYGVALSAGRDLVRHQTVSRLTPGFVNVGELAAATLREAGHGFEDLERLAVNVGPGNLGSVRAGVSYANGLAFSLQVPVLGVDSLTLTAIQAGRPGGPPCCASATPGAATSTPDSSVRAPPS